MMMMWPIVSIEEDSEGEKEVEEGTFYLFFGVFGLWNELCFVLSVRNFG